MEQGDMETLMYEGKDLLQLGGEHVSQYALKVARALWSTEELEERMVSPMKSADSTKIRPAMSPGRVTIFKGEYIRNCVGCVSVGHEPFNVNIAFSGKIAKYIQICSDALRKRYGRSHKIYDSARLAVNQSGIDSKKARLRREARRNSDQSTAV